MLAPISEESKRRAQRLARQAVTRFVLATAGAVGAALGERAVDWLFGKDDDAEEGTKK